MITFEECKIAGYPARTRENIFKSDLTIAFALDFTSAGEKLTKKLCDELGKVYISMNLANLSLDPLRIVKIAKFVSQRKLKDVRLNIAGNGIYSLLQTQGFYNDWMKDFFRAYTGCTHNLFNTISVRSGGQTGMDEAGIIGANADGYECTVLAPKGWMFRGKDHKDIYDETLFKSRFQ